MCSVSITLGAFEVRAELELHKRLYSYFSFTSYRLRAKSERKLEHTVLPANIVILCFEATVAWPLRAFHLVLRLLGGTVPVIIIRWRNFIKA